MCGVSAMANLASFCLAGVMAAKTARWRYQCEIICSKTMAIGVLASMAQWRNGNGFSWHLQWRSMPVGCSCLASARENRLNQRSSASILAMWRGISNVS
jgi:hypothetical protein